jgi:hypothetical protein
MRFTISNLERVRKLVVMNPEGQSRYVGLLYVSIVVVGRYIKGQVAVLLFRLLITTRNVAHETRQCHMILLFLSLAVNYMTANYNVFVFEHTLKLYILIGYIFY